MKLGAWLLELLYPSRCCFCHRITDKPDERVCPRCRDTLPYTRTAAQQRLPGGCLCVSPLYYEKDVRLSLHRYKFGGVRSYADIYAAFMTKCIDENRISCDSITWVPLSRKRQRRRGYNQAQLLAGEIAENLSLPCAPLLEKPRDNPAQSGMEGAQRKQNVAGVYRVCAGADPKGRRLLLVDDIVTSGETLSECARTLLRAGAKEVVCVTVARKRG